MVSIYIVVVSIIVICHSPKLHIPAEVLLSLLSTGNTGMSLLRLVMGTSAITQVSSPEYGPGYVSCPKMPMSILARSYLPGTFYRDFSLLLHLQLRSREAGVVFSVTDSDQHLLLVGLKLSAVQMETRQLQFFYTQPGSDASHLAASFPLPVLTDSWTRLALAVVGNQAVLYVNCDPDPITRHFNRGPGTIKLEACARIFVGSAGRVDPDNFVVCTLHRLLRWLGTGGK